MVISLSSREEAASYANVTKSTANFLKNHEKSKRIIFDNVLNLNNNTISEVCSQFKIKHHNLSLYRPKMNGVVDAAIKNIKKMVGESD